MNTSPRLVYTPQEQSLIAWLHVIYGLHAVGLGIGMLSSASVVGSFILAPASLIALILGYIKRSDAEGSWLASHFAWQIRTFWTAVLFGGVIVLVSLPLMLVLVGFAVLPIGLFILGIWVIVRIARGWMALLKGQSMPV